MGLIRLRKSHAEAARRRLEISDHEVIKAMEKRLIADGDLPAEFGAARDALRKRAKGERVKKTGAPKPNRPAPGRGPGSAAKKKRGAKKKA